MVAVTAGEGIASGHQGTHARRCVNGSEGGPDRVGSAFAVHPCGLLARCSSVSPGACIPYHPRGLRCPLSGISTVFRARRSRAEPTRGENVLQRDFAVRVRPAVIGVSWRIKVRCKGSAALSNGDLGSNRVLNEYLKRLSEYLSTGGGCVSIRCSNDRLINGPGRRRRDRGWTRMRPLISH